METAHTTTAAAAPSLDTVFVLLTLMVEHDYIERRVFPALRICNAAELKASGSLHFLTDDEAEAVLDDARARLESSRGSASKAYTALVRNLTAAIEQAKGRRAIFEAPAAVQTYKSDYSEDWRGTKEQLQAIGVCLAGPWPTEPGGKRRWQKATDSKGRAVHITRYWGYDHWPWLFHAEVQYLDSERPPAPHNTERENQVVRARMELDATPKSAEDFRWECINDIRRAVAMHTQMAAGQLGSGHGYTLSEESVDAILMSLDAVVQAIDEAEVNFDAERHQQHALKWQHVIAASDRSFQANLASLAKPNPKILEGRPS